MPSKVLNPKDHTLRLFSNALVDITVGGAKVKCLEGGENFLAYWVEDESEPYERHFYFDDTRQSLEKRILLDSEVESFLPKEALAGFLLSHLDTNAIMVMEKIVLIWEDEDGRSKARDALENEYGDEYAQYVAEDMLGQTWVDRQILVVNVSKVYESCQNIYDKELDHQTFEEFFAESVLQTMFHESRHLFYECNEIVPIGKGTPYPQNGGLEDEVEEYGNREAERSLEDFLPILKSDCLMKLLEEKELYATSKDEMDME